MAQSVQISAYLKCCGMTLTWELCINKSLQISANLNEETDKALKEMINLSY